MEKVTVYIEAPLKMLNKKAYEVNKINYELNGRKMISNKNGKLELNSYFIKEMENYSEKSINHIYLFLSKNIENPDGDFDIGFNNMEDNFETEMIFQELFSNNVCFLVLRPNNFEIKTEMFDKSSVKSIWKRYKTCYEIDDQKGYIVEIQKFQDLIEINKYIEAFLFDFEGRNISKIKDFYEKRNLDEIVSMCSFLVVRTPYFSGYNISIYTEKNVEETLKKLYSFFEHKKIEYSTVNLNN